MARGSIQVQVTTANAAKAVQDRWPSPASAKSSHRSFSFAKRVNPRIVVTFRRPNGRKQIVVGSDPRYHRRQVS